MKRVFQTIAIVLMAGAMMGAVGLLRKGVENAQVAHKAELVALRQEAQTMLDSKWVLASVFGPIHEETYQYTVVEMPSGRVVNFQIWTKDTEAEKYRQLQIKKGPFKFEFKERPETAKYIASLSAFLVPVEASQ